MSKDIFKLAGKIKKGMNDAEDYNTGLVGEQLIVSAYKTMPLDKLLKLRYILNGIIKKKKEAQRIKNASINNNNDNNDNGKLSKE